MNYSLVSIRFITDLTKGDGIITAKTVYFVATCFSLLACQSDHKHNSAFFKLITLVMKACGCTKDLMNCFNQMGLCESYQSVAKLRTFLAEADEIAITKQASLGVCHIIFDNMDIYVKTLHQLTLPLLMFELHPTSNFPKDDALSMEDSIKLFTPEILNLNSDKYKCEKDHFLEVVHTVIARKICGKIKGLEWIKGLFDEHYNHPYSQTACSQTILHIEPPKALDEKKTSRYGCFVREVLKM